MIWNTISATRFEFVRSVSPSDNLGYRLTVSHQAPDLTLSVRLPIWMSDRAPSDIVILASRSTVSDRPLHVAYVDGLVRCPVSQHRINSASRKHFSSLEKVQKLKRRQASKQACSKLKVCFPFFFLVAYTVKLNFVFKVQTASTNQTHAFQAWTWKLRMMWRVTVLCMSLSTHDLS